METKVCWHSLVSRTIAVLVIKRQSSQGVVFVDIAPVAPQCQFATVAGRSDIHWRSINLVLSQPQQRKKKVAGGRAREVVAALSCYASQTSGAGLYRTDEPAT